MRARPEVGPQGFEEVAIRTERYTADHIAQGGAEEDGQQRARARKNDIEESLPDGIVDVGAQFNAEAA